MAKSQETFSKKEKEKKKQQKKKEKEQRKAERKANAREGKSLEDMLAYVDENGNLSATPPDPNRKTSVKADDIVLGARNTGPAEGPSVHTGRVTFFNTSKGYGFIKDDATGDSVFVHVNALTEPLNENDRVTFHTDRTPKGLSAVNVRKI